MSSGTSRRTDLRDAYARAELERAQRADGVQITYSHQGGNAVTLWARVADAVVEAADEAGCLLEGEVRRFRIPRQTGFAGEVSENDEITWNSVVYVVLRGWRTEHYDALWIVTARKADVRRASP